MRATVEAYVGSNERSVTDADETCVDDSTVEIDKDILAKLEIGTVVGVKRRFNPGVVVKQPFILFRCGGLGWEGCWVADDAAELSFGCKSEMILRSVLSPELRSSPSRKIGTVVVAYHCV